MSTPIFTTTPAEKIAILFKEYETLRGEIASRTSNLCSIVTLGATVIVGTFSWFITSETARHHKVSLTLLLLALVCVFTYFSVRIIRFTHYSARRVRQIERKINMYAGHENDPLLEWESRWGAISIGLFRWRLPEPVNLAANKPS